MCCPQSCRTPLPSRCGNSTDTSVVAPSISTPT
jgi:hypothetical protein